MVRDSLGKDGGKDNHTTPMHTIGIDIGKSFHVAAIQNQEGRFILSSLKFGNSQEGFQLLLQKIQEIIGRDNNVLKETRIALEATGHYWMNLYVFLREQGYENLIVLNPLQSKALRNLTIRGTKTDTVDAQSIARVVQLDAHGVQHPLHENIYALCQLARLRVELVQQIADEKRKVIRLLDLVFPEFQALFSDVFGATARVFLEQYTTPEVMAGLSRKRIGTIIERCARGRLDIKDTTDKIRNAAKQSVGIRFAKDALVCETQLHLKQIAFLEEQIKDVENAMKPYADKLPSFQLLMTIPGIAFNLAATILGEIGDIQRFSKADALVAYAGMDTKVVQSGNFVGTKTKLSKRGSPYLRWAFSCAATVARVHDPALKKIFEKKQNQGKAYGVSLTAVVHKLLHITYSVLKQQKPYECHMPN